MRKLTYLELISPYPIPLQGIGHLVHPTIARVIGLGVNDFAQSNYDGMANILCLNISRYFKMIGAEESYNLLSDDEKAQLNIFDFWVSSEENISLILQGLSFFIDEDIIFDKENSRLVVCDKTSKDIVGVIDRGNYEDICELIKQMNYIEDENIHSGKPKNKKAAELLAKLKKAQERQKSNKQNNSNINIANMVSALCVHHNSYNMKNIWSLTIYQLYDQFFRQNIKNQIDISARRWAAFGQEPFNYELWYQSMKQ